MEMSNHGYAQYTREEIISLIQQYYKKNGKIVIRDLRHKNGLPSVAQIIGMFGSFQQCLIDSEIDIDIENNGCFNREQLSNEEIIERYKKFLDKHLKTHMFLPNNDEIDAERTMPVSGTILYKFGSFDNLNALAGYNAKEFNNKRLEKDMLEKYKNACCDIGRTLNSREITALSKSGYPIYSTEAYTSHFGTLSNLQKICNFTPTRIGRNITREGSIEALKRLATILGRNPVMEDLKLYDFCPSGKFYNSEFGSFKEAKKIAGLGTFKRLKTKNGVRCNSTYELKLAQVFEHYNITYQNEIMYKTVIPNFNRLYRFDFVIDFYNKKYYIELFGITGNEEYYKRKEEKIELCKKYNIPLIQFYQEDIFAKLDSEIYDILLNRIDEIDCKKVA